MSKCIDHGQKGNRWGYGMTRRRIAGARYNLALHRIAYAAHHGLDVTAMPFIIRHTCDNPRCVNPEHLLAGTVADNSRDMVERGRSLTGERNIKAKLTVHKVNAIRTAYGEGGIRQVDLAKQYGVSQRTISMIVRKERWSHV